MPRKKSKNSDRPLKASEADDVRACIDRGYAHLKLKPGASVMRVQKAMRDVVDAVTPLRRAVKPSPSQSNHFLEMKKVE